MKKPPALFRRIIDIPIVIDQAQVDHAGRLCLAGDHQGQSGENGSDPCLRFHIGFLIYWTRPPIADGPWSVGAVGRTFEELAERNRGALGVTLLYQDISEQFKDLRELIGCIQACALAWRWLPANPFSSGLKQAMAERGRRRAYCWAPF